MERRSDLSIDERAARDAVERDADGKLVDHVYNPDVAAFHEARQRIDEHYVPESAEARERREEAADKAERPARGGKRAAREG